VFDHKHRFKAGHHEPSVSDIFSSQENSDLGYSIICFTGSYSGNPAYNASKAAVKSLTESLAYELRQTNTKLTAHLFM